MNKITNLDSIEREREREREREGERERGSYGILALYLPQQKFIKGLKIFQLASNMHARKP
jgi:hypothetical protein